MSSFRKGAAAEKGDAVRRKRRAPAFPKRSRAVIHRSHRPRGLLLATGTFGERGYSKLLVGSWANWTGGERRGLCRHTGFSQLN